MRDLISMAATIHDVAKLAGVHPSTVSRVQNGKAKITKETKDRILSAMKELDYHPNSIARNLANGLSGAIGVVVDAKDVKAFSNVFFSRSLFAIEQVAQSRGYNVIIANGGNLAGNAVETLVLQRKVDGLVLPPSTVKRALIQKMADFPVVILGQPDTERLTLSWVDNNNEQGAELAVEHLYRKGYQKIAYLGGDKNLGFVNRRIKGYLNALQTDMSAAIINCESVPEKASKAATDLLTSREPPDAVLCNDNMVALGLLQAARKLNIGVPSQLGIVAFDNYPFADYTDPPLTVIDIDTALLGEQTARLLFQRIERKTTNQQILLSAMLIQRESSDRK